MYPSTFQSNPVQSVRNGTHAVQWPNGFTSAPEASPVADPVKPPFAVSPPHSPAGPSPQQGSGVAPQIPLPELGQVSGRYSGLSGNRTLELRVDVDRDTTVSHLSGDIYETSGGTTSYANSFIAPALAHIEFDKVTAWGPCTFSDGSPDLYLTVTVNRHAPFNPPSAALVAFRDAQDNVVEQFLCHFVSTAFRSLHLEVDKVSDVATPVFERYDTASFPSGKAARQLSVIDAYAEAGIEVIASAASDVVDASLAAGSWSDAELHNAMQEHFSEWQDSPQWAVWLLVAELHDRGPGLYGIMFDDIGANRQGCAVFHAGIGGTTPERNRLQLYTYVHELGHCFNLLHSWQKHYAVPAQPSRPNALSWMNYPFNYPQGGESAYWSRFGFEFDREEIIHLRHGYRDNVIFGGSDFITGSALHGTSMPRDPARDESGLRFEISTARPNFALGEPVVLELALTTVRPTGQKVHGWLHPRFSMVRVVVQTPAGNVVDFEPLSHALVGDGLRDLRPGEAIRDSAYIGFGAQGHYFDAPGTYRVRAVYAAIDGSQVVSPLISLRVNYPGSREEDEVAELMTGAEQGKLLTMLGSDADSLMSGNAALELLLDKYPKNTVTNYARLVKGVNASRDFKSIAGERLPRLTLRSAQPEQATTMLKSTIASGVLDPVSTWQVMDQLQSVQVREGLEKEARATARKKEAMSLSLAE